MTTQIVLRNPNLDPIGMDQLKRFSPAVFAKEPRSDVSKRYGFMPTYTVLEHMHKAGFVPVEVRNYQRRDPAAFRATKHLIRFRQAGSVAGRIVGDLVPQIVLLNSHDRTSTYQLCGGMFRLICLNGLLVADSQFVEPIKLRHTANLAETVVEVSMKLIKAHAHVFDHVKEMRKTQLAPKAQLAFARNALALKDPRAGIIDPAALLVARRAQDEGNDVWRVFNRVQENLTKGGIEGRTTEGRHVRTAEVRSINADVSLNAGLWALAMQAISKASKSSKRVIEGESKVVA